MVKGVNRQIIEINDTGNKYFERVLLFVSPARSDTNEKDLYAQAQHYVSSLSEEEGRVSLRKRCRAKNRKKIIIIASSLLGIAAVAGIILLNIL